MNQKIILDLCGGTGSWSLPYREAGYYVIVVDPLADDSPENLQITVQDFYICMAMGLFDSWLPWIHGILCAPPCTEFAGSGARWWKKKD